MTYKDSGGAEREGLERVSAASDTAVHEHRDAAAGCSHHLRGGSGFRDGRRGTQSEEDWLW